MKLESALSSLPPKFNGHNSEMVSDTLLQLSALPINPRALNSLVSEIKTIVVEEEDPTNTGATPDMAAAPRTSPVAQAAPTKPQPKPEDPKAAKSNSSNQVSTLPPGTLFTIKLTLDKGYAVFANTAIKKGTLLLAEEPLIRIHNPHYLTNEIRTAYKKLSRSEKDKYWALASAHGQNAAHYPEQIYFSVPESEKLRIEEQHAARTAEKKSLLSVFMTNAMECGKGAAVFEVAARFNHSCIPNAHFAWCEKLGKETICVTKDLAVDEEITLSYCDPFYDPSMRRWELQHYGFQCKCIACTDIEVPGSFAEKSKERRWRLRELDDSFEVQPSQDQKIRMGIEMAKLMREEGLCTPNLAHTYLQIARISADRNDFNMAVRGAKLAYEVYLTCLGKDNEKTKKAEMSVRAFTKQLLQGKTK